MAKQEKRDWVSRPEPAPPASGAEAPAVDPERGERLEGAALHLLVLLCGAGLMSLEMVGARVLWNNFGSSVFVWGSIISVFMAALAAGYYLGGVLADRRPSLAWLAGIVGAAGLMIMLLTHLSVRICGAVDSADFGPRAGPLVASLLLYFLPSLLLGAVSPFAVRLSARALAGLGNVAGRLYALGTAGSLAGTLVTTFVLIPMMGTSRILYAIGVLLVASAILGLAARFAARGGPRSSAGKAATVAFLTGTFVLGYVLNPANLPFSPPPPSGVTLDQRSPQNYHFLVGNREYESAYHTIAVVGRFDATKYGQVLGPDGQPLRDDRGQLRVDPQLGMKEDPDAILEMRFNNLTESAIYPNRPGKPPQTTYTRILHLGMALNPRARKVMVMGLGGGSVPREFREIYKDLDQSVDVVEVDPQVARVACEQFGFDPTGKVRAFITDGRQFVRNADRAQPRLAVSKGAEGGELKLDFVPEKALPRYDLIILDAYSGGGQIPAHLVTREFLEQVRERLEPDGVLVSNIISATEGPKSLFFRAEYRTMKEFFPHIYVFRSRSAEPREIINLILVAPRSDGPELRREELVAKAEALLAAYPELKKRTERLAYSQATGSVQAIGHLEKFAEDLFLPSKAELAKVPVLTDEHAPVETMFYWSTRFAR